MTFGFGIQVILEVLVILLIAYGIKNEDKLIEFEDELYPVLKFCYHKYLLKDINRKRQTPVSNQKKVLKKKATFSVVNGKKASANSRRHVA